MAQPEPFPIRTNPLSDEELAQLAIITPEDVQRAIADATPAQKEAIDATLINRRGSVQPTNRTIPKRCEPART